MQQQQCLQTPTPRKKKKEASPWWDVFSHCKEAADSSSDSEHDDLSYYEQYCNDVICTPSATNTADDGPIIEETAPLSPQSVVRTTPVKSISDSRSDNYVSGENVAARPATPGTQDSSFSSLETSSSSSVPDDNDMRELSFESIETGEGEVEGEEEEEESNFIGNILLEIKPISPLLSTKQRNIRKNAYHLLKRLGEEGSIVDLNSSIETEVGQEEEEECNDATKDDGNVTSVGSNSDDDHNDDDIMAELHAEIANLTNQLQAATLQSTQDASKIKSLETQLQQALNELNEYEETIDSVNEAVDRCHLYNEEIVKELIVSRKENDDLAMRLFDQESKEKEEEKDNNNSNELPSSEGDTNTSQKITDDATDENSEASLVEDDMKNENDDATTATASSPMTCDQFPSVFHRQQPLSALQDHLLSCIKLPLRVLSILFSVWVIIILLRIVFIFSLIVMDRNSLSLLEDGGFNTPGIY